MNTFIDENKLSALLERSKSAPGKDVSAVVKKSLKLKGLSIEETALLLQTEDRELLEEIFKAANTVKEEMYRKRLVLFPRFTLPITASTTASIAGFGPGTKNLNAAVSQLKR